MSLVTRKIAEHELDQCFPGLDTRTRNDLATSLVRQWIEYDGNAVFVTPSDHYWFRATTLDDGQTQVARNRQVQTFVDYMRRSRVVEAEIPDLLYVLNMQQNVMCQTDDGEKLRLRVDPAKPMFYVEMVPDDDDSTF